jgi:predicted nucleic acid-binding protein
VGFRVFVDANILVSGRWRDVVLTLAEGGNCVVLWSAKVLEEVERNLPESMSPDDREALFQAVGAAFPEALVEWPGAIDVVVKLAVNSKDQHVIAAALWGHADVVLTDDQNLQS